MERTPPFPIAFLTTKQCSRSIGGSNSCQPRKGLGQNEHPIVYLLWRRILIRTMADPAAARNENHRRGTDLCHEQRIMIGSAYHSFDRQAQLTAYLQDHVYQTRVAHCWSIDVEPFALKFNASALADFRDHFFYSQERGISGFQLCVPQVNFQPRAERHAVYGARFNAEHAGRPYRIRAARTQRR